jgi:thioredoxin reductase (NADPH)
MVQSFKIFNKRQQKRQKKIPEYDHVIVGGGPAGLAAAIHAGSEGHKVAVLDSSHKFGGQAISSRAIENYPGFPDAISGKALFNRKTKQANKFGCDLHNNATVASLNPRKNGTHVVTTHDGRQFIAKSVLLSPGLHYNRIPELDTHLGKGVHYGMPDRMERSLNETPGKKHVVLVGAGNSSGQAADKIRRMKDTHVHIVSRGPAENYMSDYLLHKRLKVCKNVTFHQGSVTQTHGDHRMTHVTLSNGRTIQTGHAIVYAGATPRTQWLSGSVEMNEKGFIHTGEHVKKPVDKNRRLSDHETSLPGVFAAGDVRYNSTKRIHAAGAEGLSAFLQMRAHNEKTFNDDTPPATRFVTGKSKKPLPRKAPPLPKRLNKKPATVKVLAKKLGKGRVSPKSKPLHPAFMPKPLHPVEMDRKRAKLTARAISSLSTVKKKPTKNRVKVVKESILLEGRNAPEKGEGRLLWHGSKSPEPVEKFHSLSHFGTKNQVRQVHGRSGKVKSFNAVRIKHGKSFNTNDIRDHDPESLLHHLHTKGMFSKGEYDTHWNKIKDIRSKSKRVYHHPKNTVDQNEYLASKIKEKGFDTIRYKNRYEDKGKTSYIITHPDQVRTLKKGKTDFGHVISRPRHKSCSVEKKK